MKHYRVGIILGVVSILCSLLFVGIPVGFNNIIEIITAIFFAAGLVIIACLGFVAKNDKVTAISSVIYAVILFVLVTAVELNCEGYILLAIGFAPGLVISITGIVKTAQVKSENKIKASFIFNIAGLVLSVANFMLALLSGSLIIQ